MNSFIGPSTSPSLLLRIRDSADAQSWNDFQSIYQPIVVSYCRRRGIQHADAEDITQEVMVAIAKSIQSFEYQPGLGRFRSWLATVTANKLRNHIRKRRPDEDCAATWLDDLADRPESDSTWTTLFIERVFAVACSNVQGNVEHRTWQCFELTWLQNRDSQEVARRLGIPIHTVYVNKSRVLKRVEEEFRHLCDDYPYAQDSDFELRKTRPR